MNIYNFVILELSKLRKKLKLKWIKVADFLNFQVELTVTVNIRGL